MAVNVILYDIILKKKKKSLLAAASSSPGNVRLATFTNK